MCVLVLNSSCQALFQLPLLLLQLPIRILGMVFQMLPYLIKLAPIALLFIEDKGEHATEYYASLPMNAPSMAINDTVTCYVIDLDDKENAMLIAQQVAKNDDKMVFLNESSIFDSPEHVFAIYKNMQRNDIQFAYDERVTAEVSSSDMYNV
jgi:hypothetical protein